MNRIESIVSFINKNDLVVDVGCDQAEASILLAKNNIKSIASDISNKVIEKAKEKVSRLNFESLIDLRVSNGLEKICKNEADTLVLAGMGAYTIIEILNNTKLKFKKIITISNNNNDMLRIEMNNLNYKIDSDLIIY